MSDTLQPTQEQVIPTSTEQQVENPNNAQTLNQTLDNVSASTEQTPPTPIDYSFSGISQENIDETVTQLKRMETEYGVKNFTDLENIVKQSNTQPTNQLFVQPLGQNEALKLINDNNIGVEELNTYIGLKQRKPEAIAEVLVGNNIDVFNESLDLTSPEIRDRVNAVIKDRETKQAEIQRNQQEVSDIIKVTAALNQVNEVDSQQIVNYLTGMDQESIDTLKKNPGAASMLIDDFKTGAFAQVAQKINQVKNSGVNIPNFLHLYNQAHFSIFGDTKNNTPQANAQNIQNTQQPNTTQNITQPMQPTQPLQPNVLDNQLVIKPSASQIPPSNDYNTLVQEMNALKHTMCINSINTQEYKNAYKRGLQIEAQLSNYTNKQ